MANSDRVARYAHDKKDLAGHLRRHGIDLVEDLGSVGFTDPHTLTAAGGVRSWSADRIILAVGGHAGRLRIPGAGCGDLAMLSRAQPMPRPPGQLSSRELSFVVPVRFNIR